MQWAPELAGQSAESASCCGTGAKVDGGKQRAAALTCNSILASDSVQQPFFSMTMHTGIEAGMTRTVQ